MKSSWVWRWLKSRRSAVLKGGWSRERRISLQTGAAVEAAFKRLGLPAIGLDATPNIVQTLKAKKIQFCFLALHGAFGEDGGVQACLDVLKLPYTGSGVLASALAMNKDMAKKVFRQANVPTAPWKTIKRDDFLKAQKACLKTLSAFLSQGPVFVKPADQGSALGISRVDRKPQLPLALQTCFKMSETALVERYVQGRELTVAVLGEDALPVIEIVPKHRFYDFHSKYARGGSQHIVPAQLSFELSKKAQGTALAAFKALGCQVYGRVDMIMKRNGEMVVLEVNTIPGMTPTSLLPDAARAAGLTFDELVIEIVNYSLKARQ